MKILSIFYLLLLITSCKTKTTPVLVISRENSDNLNLPTDSLAFYFPVHSFHERASLDSFVQNWYSSALYSFKEPLLSQNFIGHNIYRFLWLRSFHRPVVITLHQSEDQVWLNTKMLDKQPGFYDDRILGIPKDQIEDYIKAGYAADKNEPDLLVRIADRKASVIYNKDSSLSRNEWKLFEQLLTRANFWTLPRRINDGSTDGAHWVIEAHLKNKYHLVDYHSPYDNDFEKAGLFLIKLSGLKEEVY